MDGIDPDIVAKFRKDGLTYGEISDLKKSMDSREVYQKALSEDIRETCIIDTTNPVPYHASGFGHKLHLDQKEKVKFGVTHVFGVDGYSGLIVSHFTMLVKNNINL
uniref:Uncharacterized protein n=1 Tax=Amphimedon queenslandica TaxID=400682 RepID=A0A1X7UCZ5_AMPQE